MEVLSEVVENGGPLFQGVDHAFELIISVLSYLFSAIAIVVLTIAVAKTVAAYCRHKPCRQMQLCLAEGMQLSLQFLLGSEILHTIIAENWGSILVVSAIIVLRFALNFSIHWETKHIQH